MKKIIFFLLIVFSCHIPREKAVILEYQGVTISRQMGLNDVYDTIRTYKAMYIKDSVCFTYKVSNAKFAVGDKIIVIR